MATANINVRTDAELKMQAQQIFESIGLDLSTAVNLFLKQTVKANNLPFVIGAVCAAPAEPGTDKRISRYGVWKRGYSLPKDSDAPLNDFVETNQKIKLGFVKGSPLPDSFFDPLPEEELQAWGL